MDPENPPSPFSRGRVSDRKVSRSGHSGRWCTETSKVRERERDESDERGEGVAERKRREHGSSRSVVPPRNHRRRRPLVWKNDSSVLTECPCFYPPPLRFEAPTGVAGRVDCGGWLQLRGWRNAGVGGVRAGERQKERETRCLLPIPLSPRHSCVCLYEDLSNSPSPSLAFSCYPFSIASLSPSLPSTPLTGSPLSRGVLVADLGVMTYRVSSARRSQTPFL